ncbi:MAG: glycosyltransferase family 2 protein [Anaerolineales bacterium]|nr:glycosyltransferase family 2 protein [Anaerolineales bacterium]
MKLIIQIPCYNEAQMLPATLADLPTALPGIDQIETLVVDDGSRDDTVAVARRLGVTHVVRHPQNLGLAKAFQTGLDACLQRGADVVVNTDADNQYPGRYVAELVAPILAGEADIVIANRQVAHIAHFSPLKRLLQQLGSWTVRTVSGTDVPDAPSGFRAYTRDAALRLTILTRFSYTLETIIQAGKMGLAVKSIPIETNVTQRPSRLQRSMWHFIKAQAGTIVRLYAFYEPLRTFTYLAMPFLLVGLGTWLRFLIIYLQRGGYTGLLQSLTIGTGLFIVGVLIQILGILADSIGKHRQLTQETLYRLKKMELDQKVTQRNAEETQSLTEL